jgi:uncharacterized membrane protein YfcA
MLESFDVWMVILMGLISLLYASVGHGGASGFIAVMALWSMPTNTMRVIALALNVMVSFISFVHYYINKHFKWQQFYPFALASIPAAILGSTITLDHTLFKTLLGILLLVPMIRLSIASDSVLVLATGLDKELQEDGSGSFRINFKAAAAVGGTIGFLSGLLGIGGGILLSPVILFFAWASVKETAAVTALFTFANSVVGLLTQLHHWKDFAFFPAESVLLFSIVLIGGWFGSWWGSGPAQEIWIKRALALVLGIASWKLITV